MSERKWKGPKLDWGTHIECVDSGTCLGDVTRTVSHAYAIESSSNTILKDPVNVFDDGKIYCMKIDSTESYISSLEEKIRSIKTRISKLERSSGKKSPKPRIFVKSNTVTNLHQSAALKVNPIPTIVIPETKKELPEAPKVLETPKSPQSTRNQVLAEFLRSENIYLENLRILEEIFHKPLMNHPDEDIQELQPKIKAIFSNLVVITNTSINLLEALTAEKQKRPDEPHIGKVLVDLLPYFSVYTPYISGYNGRITMLKELRKNDKFLEVLLELEASHPERLAKRTLNDILIHPVKRIPQYSILMERLVKHTPEDHPDYKNIITARDKLHEMSEHFEEQSKNAASAKEVIRVMNTIRVSSKFKNFTFSKPSRVLEFEDQVKVFLFKKKSCWCSAFAFNDCVLFTSKSKFRSTNLIKGYFYFTEVDKVVESEQKGQITIVIQRDGDIETIKIVETTNRNMSIWTQYLVENERLAKLKEQQRKKLKPMVKRPSLEKSKSQKDLPSRDKIAMWNSGEQSDVIMHLNTSSGDSPDCLRRSSSQNSISSKG